MARMLGKSDEVTSTDLECFERDFERHAPITLSRMVATTTKSSEEMRASDLAQYMYDHGGYHGKPYLENLASEIMLHILDLGRFSDIDLASLSLTCTRLASLVKPYLYKAVSLDLGRIDSKKGELLLKRLVDDRAACEWVKECSVSFDPAQESTVFLLTDQLRNLRKLKLRGPLSVSQKLTPGSVFDSLSFINLGIDCSQSILPTILSLPSLSTLYLRSLSYDFLCKSNEFRAHVYKLRDSSLLSSLHISCWEPSDGFREILTIPKRLETFSACFCPQKNLHRYRPLSDELESQRTTIHSISIALDYRCTEDLVTKEPKRTSFSDFTKFGSLRHLEIDETLIVPAAPFDSTSIHDSSHTASQVLPRDLQSLKVRSIDAAFDYHENTAK